MVEYVLSKPGFYFSYTYDLTHTMQRRHHLSCTKQNFSSIPLYERADERFLWNSHLLQDFVVLPELHRFIVPVIHGFVCIKRSVINGRYLTFCVISRRDTQRAGVRYYRRGIDSAGNVANYIETEQIVLCGDDAVSFVQVCVCYYISLMRHLIDDMQKILIALTVQHVCHKLPYLLEFLLFSLVHTYLVYMVRSVKLKNTEHVKA